MRLFGAILVFAFLVLGCDKEKLEEALPSELTTTTTTTTTLPATACTTCRIFVSATTTAGNFGSVSAADAICMADANKPAGSETYKAMLVEGTTRRACTTDNCSGGTSEQIDWVLKPNTAYTRVDGTAIGTTDAVGLLGASVTNSIAGGGTVWTGILYFEDIGRITERWTNSGSDCNGWTDNSNGLAGQTGMADMTDYRYIDGGNPVCASTLGFYCVEQ